MKTTKYLNHTNVLEKTTVSKKASLLQKIALFIKFLQLHVNPKSAAYSS